MMDKDADNLKARMKERLTAVGMNQRKLAAAVGLKYPQTITGWLKRDTIPAEHLHKVCRELKCNSEWLLKGTESKLPGKTSPIDLAVLEEVLTGTHRVMEDFNLDWDHREASGFAASMYMLFIETGAIPDFEQAARLAVMHSGTA